MGTLSILSIFIIGNNLSIYKPLSLIYRKPGVVYNVAPALALALTLVPAQDLLCRERSLS